MLMNVGQSAPRYEIYAVLYPSSASLRQKLCNYFSVVISLCKSAILFVQKPFFSQTLDALRKPFDDEFGNFQKDLVRFGDAVREEVSLAAKQQQSLDSMEASREQKENSLFRRTGALFQQEAAHQLAESKKRRENKFRSRILNSCSTYNHETVFNQARRKGASNWLFETNEYREWKSSSSSSVLLCSGIVGAGKTVLSSSVVEELVVNKGADTSVGYFFCSYDDFVSLKAQAITGSLARQFLGGVPAKDFNKLDPDVGGMSFNIQQLVSHMLGLLAPNKQYMIILDGLDECELHQAHLLFQALQSLLTSSTQVFKLFWTGRSDFVEKASHQLHSHFHVRISQSHSGSEISRFIEFALDEALEDGRLQLRDPRIIVQIQDALEREACEMLVVFTTLLVSFVTDKLRFLWVTFQIDSICRENTDEGILKALENLPKDLPTTYRRILRRLRDTGLTDPLMGKKVFEIVSAARRPLTLEELREAISIDPGDTKWTTAKLVNDMMKALDCCGSLVVVDEELSTVHFAHSSVKRHLENSPNPLDIPEYHVRPTIADTLLGRIIVTYLNLDVLQKRVVNAINALQSSATTHNASTILRAGLPHGNFVSTLAQRLLKNRKIAGYDVGRDMERVAGFTREPSVHSQQANSFLSYAQKHWLSHTQFFVNGRPSESYTLWARLIDGDVPTLELPYTPEDVRSFSPQFMIYLVHCMHPALIFCVFENVRKQGQEGIYGLKWLLKTFHTWDSPADTLIDAIIDQNIAQLQLLLIEQTVRIPQVVGLFGTMLHVALLCGNLEIVEILLRHGANVKATGGPYGSVMRTAAVSSFSEQVIPLLLKAGAHDIPLDDSYSDDVERILQYIPHLENIWNIIQEALRRTGSKIGLK